MTVIRPCFFRRESAVRCKVAESLRLLNTAVFDAEIFHFFRSQGNRPQGIPVSKTFFGYTRIIFDHYIVKIFFSEAGFEFIVAVYIQKIATYIDAEFLK